MMSPNKLPAVPPGTPAPTPVLSFCQTVGNALLELSPWPYKINAVAMRDDPAVGPSVAYDVQLESGHVVITTVSGFQHTKYGEATSAYQFEVYDGAENLLGVEHDVRWMKAVFERVADVHTTQTAAARGRILGELGGGATLG